MAWPPQTDAGDDRCCLRVFPPPTYASWANPIEPQCGLLRMFTMANSDYPNHTVLAALQAHLRR